MVDYSEKKKQRRKPEREGILDEALKRFGVAEEAWSEIYEKALEDIEFVDGDEDAQWTDKALAARKDRPTMTFDKVSGSIDQVVGDHLQNRPGVKVIGAEDDDADVAEIYEGLIRQIESRGVSAYSTGFKFAVKGGIGYWRIKHDYLCADSFDQDIILDEISNPFSVLPDPCIQHESAWKMRYAFVFEDMPKDEFEAKWPKAQSSTSNDLRPTGTAHSWISEDEVRVADYYRLVKVEKEIGLTSDRQVLFVEDYPDQQFIDTRKTKIDKLERFKITSMEILEEYECVGAYVPIVPIFGKRSNIDGKMVVRGLVRKAKDAQRLYNYERSNYIESVALQPKQPYFATPKMLEGHEERWRNMNIQNDPVLLYNADQNAPGGMPKRESPAQVPSGLVQGLALSSDDIKSTTGIYDASLGARSNETSGRAIMARQREGDTATYEFTDEFAKAVEHTGKIYIDLIPKIYDATRTIRILGEDDAEEVVQIFKPVMNWETGEYETTNDLSRGKYDVKVRVGPSYTTRRIETAEQLSQIIQQNPEMGAIISDIYYSSLDLVGADELVKRMRKILIKKGIVEPNDDEKAEMAQQMQSPQAQQQKQMRQMAAQLEMANKKADTAEKQAQAKEREASAALKQMEALAKQMEIQAQQADMQGLVANIARMMAVANRSPVAAPVRVA